jgi:hypothetical protein
LGVVVANVAGDITKREEEVGQSANATDRKKKIGIDWNRFRVSCK